MSYKLGKHSRDELAGVHPILVQMVTEAIKISKQDFIVFDGLRTVEEQRRNIAKKVSKTMNSYHLYGLAVDLVPFVNGEPKWENPSKTVTNKWYDDIAVACKTIILRDKLPVDRFFDMYGWDLPHWQITTLNGIDARKVYDFRKGGYVK